jgi:hypothetical protein
MDAFCNQFLGAFSTVSSQAASAHGSGASGSGKVAGVVDIMDGGKSAAVPLDLGR